MRSRTLRAVFAAALFAVCTLPAVAGGTHESAASGAQVRGLPLVAPNSSDVVLARGLPPVAWSGSFSVYTPWLAPAAKKGDYAFQSLFEKYYPRARLDYQFLTPQSKILTVVSSRLVAGNPPTAAAIDLGMFMINFAKSGALVNLTSVWKKYDLRKLIPGGVAATAEYRGKYYGIPLLVAPHNFLWWNKKLFEEAGVRQPPYRTWSEFFTAARAFEAKMHIPFISIGLVPGEFALENAVYLAAKRYGTAMAFRILNGDATAQDFSDMLTFMKKYLSFASKGASSLDGNFGPSEQVASGQAALCMSGQWARNSFAKQGMLLGKGYGLAHLPGPNILYFVSGGFMIFKGSGKEEIGKALASLGASSAAQVDFSDKGAVPARTDVAMNPKVFPVTSFAAAKEMKNATLLPVPIDALPAQAENAYPPEVVSYLVEQQGLRTTVDNLLRLQQKYRAAFIVGWGA